MFQNLVLPLAGPNDSDLFTFRQAGEGHISALAECFDARGVIHNTNSDTTPYDVSLAQNIKVQDVTVSIILLSHGGHFDLLYV